MLNYNKILIEPLIKLRTNIIHLEFVDVWHGAAICRSLINASLFVYASLDDAVEQNFMIQIKYL